MPPRYEGIGCALRCSPRQSTRQQNTRKISSSSVEEVGGDAIIERVDDATRVKYGWQDRFIHFFRMRKPEILKLSARD